MITLYGFPRSGNTLKVRIALRLLSLPFEESMPSHGEHKRPPFTELNPLGQVPVLVDDGVVLRDSQAILVYLAAAYRPGEWDGVAPAERGSIAQWMSFAANELQHGPNALRRIVQFDAPLDKRVASNATDQALEILERHLSSRLWLESGRMTIADMACAPYVALAPQGGVNLEPFAAIRSWLGRIEAASNFPSHPDWTRQPIADSPAPPPA